MPRIVWSSLLLVALLWAPSASAATPEYFPLPAGYTASNFGVAVDDSGDLWFSTQSPAGPNPQPVASIARLRPSEAAPGTSNGITFYATPNPPSPNCCATQVRSVAFSSFDHRLYYVRSDGEVGYGVPNASGLDQLHTTTVPGAPELFDIAVKPTGGAWFTEHSASNVAPYPGDRVAAFDGLTVVEGPNVAIQNGNTSLNSLRYDAGPSGVAVAADGTPWFVEDDNGNPGYRIAHYGGGGNNYEEYLAEPCQATPPCSGSYTGTGLSGITFAQDGAIWFTNVDKGQFGRFDPSGHTITQYAVASIDPTLAGGKPRQIITAPDGTLWMTVIGGYNSASNAIVKITPPATAIDAPTAVVYHVDLMSSPLGIGADHAGNIWFGLSGNSPARLGRLAGVVGVAPAPSGSTPTTTTPTPTPVTTPGPAPIVLKPATVATASITPPQVGNGAINANQVCAGPPAARCSVIYLIKEHEYVTGFPGAGGSGASAAKAKKKAKRPKPRILGTKTVTLHGGQTAKVTVKLNALGRRILKGKHKLKVDFTATEKLAGGKTKVLSKKTLTMKVKKKG
jgi:streptogramin lyase